MGKPFSESTTPGRPGDLPGLFDLPEPSARHSSCQASSQVADQGQIINQEGVSGQRCVSRRGRTALVRSALPGTFTTARYRLSPYQGCGHGCIYCDGRAERYHVEGDFSRDIVVKENTPDLLARELPRLRERGVISIGSGITDCYQPLEEKLHLTRRCAELLGYYRFPALVMTKSSLIERDMDLWKRLNEEAGFLLLLTITTLDDDIAAIIEPGAPSSTRRLKTLERFARAGLATGVLAMPLLPEITDSSKALEGLARTVGDTGARCLIPGGLTLRPGRQKEFFLSRLAELEGNAGTAASPELPQEPEGLTEPEMKQKPERQAEPERPPEPGGPGEIFRATREGTPDLQSIYHNLYGGNAPSGALAHSYGRALFQRFRDASRTHRLAPFIPHSLYRNYVNRADEMYLVLHQMLCWYEQEGVPTERLSRAIGSYRDWLSGKRRSPSFDGDQAITDALHEGSLNQILHNPRLVRTLHRLLLEGESFEPWLS